jgi:hypothetical protein
VLLNTFVYYCLNIYIFACRSAKRPCSTCQSPTNNSCTAPHSLSTTLEALTNIMPTFSLTVGSLGDFIAMGDLIVKIGIALYRPGECTRDYQDLLRELEQLAQILSKIEICKGQRMTALAERCLKAVQAQADLTTQVVKEFLNKRESSKNGMWNKVTWVTNGPNEMAELKRTLSAHREMLSFLLEMCIGTSYLGIALCLTRYTFARLLSQQISDVIAICEDNFKDMHSIALHRPKQLTLVDAIGNHRDIPFDFCVSYEVMHLSVTLLNSF